MDILQHLRIGLSVFSLKVDDLTADHAIHCSGAASNFFDNSYACLSRAFQPGENFVGLRLQRISSKDGEGFTKDFVASRPSSTQVVVVEGGKVVVNQRVG